MFCPVGRRGICGFGGAEGWRRGGVAGAQDLQGGVIACDGGFRLTRRQVRVGDVGFHAGADACGLGALRLGQLELSARLF